MGEMDTATGVMAKDAVILPIESGTGKINFPTAGIGHKQIKGWIKFKDGTGKYNYFNYEKEYIVANAAVAVSPDKMNVFYAGVDNPLTVSAAGAATADLVVDIKGCDGNLQTGNNGKYIARVKGTGTSTITVFQKTAGKLQQQGAPQVFRVKRFPNPPLKISGRVVNSSLEMKMTEAKIINGIGLDLSNFDFNALFKVNGFTITIIIPGRTMESFKCPGSRLNPEAIAALSRLRSGSKIYFEDIKVQSPEEQRKFPMVKIVVK